MVSFYDYALLKLKTFPVLLILFLTFGCHNNAHIRTQKPLQLNEKVISVSTVLPTGGTNEDNRGGLKGVDLGIIGPRIVISMLKGKQQSETGFYGGFGLIQNSRLKNRAPLGLLLGTERKKYLRLFGTSTQKVGALFEVNILSKGGPTIHLLPSLSTARNKNNSFYFGAHGILSSGINKIGLADYEIYNSPEEWSPTSNVKEEFKYNSNSLGIGLTVGRETVFNQKSSFQLQIDFSIVNNFFSTNYRPKEKWNSLDFPLIYESGVLVLDQKEEAPFLSEKSNNYHFIISGSIGYNFFRPSAFKSQPLSPLPFLQKNVFDPETGEMLKPHATIFNPETGETIKNPDEISHVEEEEFTKRQVIELAKKNAREKHIDALWSVFGLTGIPSSALGSILGLFVLGEVSDGTLAFPGFIAGGVLGAILPSLLAKGSSKIAIVTYPLEIKTKEQERKYKKTYKSEVGLLRKKSTAVGTFGGFIALAGSIMLAIVVD